MGLGDACVQVAALVSSARKLTDAAQQQQLSGLSVEKGPGAEGGGSREEWRLAAGHPAADVGPQAELQEPQAVLHVARQQEEALRLQVTERRRMRGATACAGARRCSQDSQSPTSLLQVLQLKERCAEVEARSAELQADLAAARASAGDAATAAAAVGDLRQQLEERNKEVADLSAISLKVCAVCCCWEGDLGAKWLGKGLGFENEDSRGYCMWHGSTEQQCRCVGCASFPCRPDAPAHPALQADSTIQQYMTQLKHMATELRATELRLEDAEGELRWRTDAEHRYRLAGWAVGWR